MWAANWYQSYQAEQEDAQAKRKAEQEDAQAKRKAMIAEQEARKVDKTETAIIAANREVTRVWTEIKLIRQRISETKYEIELDRQRMRDDPVNYAKQKTGKMMKEMANKYRFWDG